jgi:hypothetical protein
MQSATNNRLLLADLRLWEQSHYQSPIDPKQTLGAKKNHPVEWFVEAVLSIIFWSTQSNPYLI